MEKRQDLLRKQLAQARARLELLEEQLSVVPDYSLGEGDPAVYEWERNLAEKRMLERKVETLEAALRRLEEGQYGVCERCGQEIDPERLRILPQTTLCVRCKREEEAGMRGIRAY